MLDDDLAHRKILRVAGCEARAQSQGRRSNEAIGLRERDTLRAEPAAPIAGTLPFQLSQRCEAKSCEEATRSFLLARPQSAYDFLGADGAHTRNVTGSAQSADAVRRGPSPKRVDQHRRVEYYRAH